MSENKYREPRVSVRLSVRIKTDFGWGDAQIQNVSSRGMMAACAAPPARGTYVEVRRGTYVVVGRVVWSSNDGFGLFAQDTIVLSALTASTTAATRGDRRTAPRTPERTRASRKEATEIGAQSARFARAFDFIAVAAAVVAGAIVLTETVRDVLAAPLQEVSEAMR